jgi:hypothetical protein
MSDGAKADQGGLRTAESIYYELLKHPSDVVISAHQAAQIWKLFRHTPISEGEVASLQNRAFLQAALMSAIDGSYAMSWIETIFRSAYKPNATIKGLLGSLLWTGLKHYYWHLKNSPPELYQIVVDDIAWSHKFYFDAISQGSED